MLPLSVIFFVVVFTISIDAVSIEQTALKWCPKGTFDALHKNCGQPVYFVGPCIAHKKCYQSNSEPKAECDQLLVILMVQGCKWLYDDNPEGCFGLCRKRAEKVYRFVHVARSEADIHKSLSSAASTSRTQSDSSMIISELNVSPPDSLLEEKPQWLENNADDWTEWRKLYDQQKRRQSDPPPSTYQKLQGQRKFPSSP